MAKRVVKTGYILLAGTEITTHAKGFTLKRSAQGIEVTTLNATAIQREGGLPDNMLSIPVLHPDDETLNDLLFMKVGTKIAFSVRRTSAAESATNRTYSGTAVLTGYDPLSGEVNSSSSTSIELAIDGEVTITPAPA